MRRKLIASLAVGAMMVTMIPGMASAAGSNVKIELGEGSISAEFDGAKINSWYYFPDGIDAGNPITLSLDNLSPDKPGEYRAWYEGGKAVDYFVEDTKAPVIDPDNTLGVHPDYTMINDVKQTVPETVPAVDSGDKNITEAELAELYYMGTEFGGSPDTSYTPDGNIMEKEGYYRAWYTVTDAYGNKASVARDFYVDDQVAPAIDGDKMSEIMPQDRGDILDIQAIVDELKANSTDNSGIGNVWVDTIYYLDSYDAWSDFEKNDPEYKYVKGQDYLTGYEMDKAGYYKLKFRVEDASQEPTVGKNVAYYPVVVKVDEITGDAGFIMNYVDKDGNKVGESTQVIREDAVLDYEYVDGVKKTFYKFVYNEEGENGFVAEPPEGYYIKDSSDFGDIAKEMKIYVANGESNTNAEYDITVTKIEQVAAGTDGTEEVKDAQPKTGDEMNMGVIAGLLAMMAAAGTGIAVVGRKAFNR